MSVDPKVDEAFSVGLRHIGIAVYSSGKIYEYLLRKGYESQIAHTAVNNLVERKYIDDTRAGRKVVNTRTGRKQESKALLYKRLLQAGIAEDKADELISLTRDDRDTCLDLIKATYPVLPDDYDEYELITEIMKLCARRGYTPEVARQSINKWIAEN